MYKKAPQLCEALWEHTGSNRGPSACKADALNQLSYAPNYFIFKNRRPLPASKPERSKPTGSRFLPGQVMLRFLV